MVRYISFSRGTEKTGRCYYGSFLPGSCFTINESSSCCRHIIGDNHFETLSSPGKFLI